MPYVKTEKRRYFFVSNFIAEFFAIVLLGVNRLEIADNGDIAPLFVETLWKNFLMKS